MTTPPSAGRHTNGALDGSERMTSGSAVTRVLVANRGEIARRVFATCRRLGIETVAVHSDADADLPFVREADAAVRLPGNTPAETYLRGELLVEAARKAGADAIHPGYGFLSENAAFAQAVVDAGLIWLGPPPSAIEAMGSKVEAKKLMETAGVPVLGNLTAETASEDDLPLLVKASAGGGGRGMRIVRTLADLPAEIATASAEAESAFGDGTVFVEPYVERSRHVEVQIWGDHTGKGIAVLGARDCSLQRRHQKVVEEAPPPGLTDRTLTAMYDAARAAAETIGYVGVGTVEFLVDADDTSRFWFLEMNTRLQVEHPITEAVTGLDLVELQVAAAEGSATSAQVIAGATTSALAPEGHAIEVRLYAEDPAADYQPQSGLLSAFDLEADVTFGRLATHGIRVDAGFEAGNEVGTHYDAMLAKVIAWAPTREAAARRLAGALARARIHGVTTNRDQLVAILRDPAFLAGEVTTGLLAGGALRNERTSVHSGNAPSAAALALAERDRLHRRVQGGIPVAWRNVVSQPQITRLAHDDEETDVRWFGGRDGYALPTDGDRRVEVVAANPDEVVLDVDGVRTRFAVAVHGDRVDVDWPEGHASLRRVPRFTDPAEAVASGSLLAPMPGTVTAVPVAVGDRVEPGQQVLVLEAMKMQHAITAPEAGVVAEINVNVGEQVASGAVLAVVSNQGADA